METLDYETAIKYFKYDAYLGELSWRVDRGRIRANSVISSKGGAGYVKVMLNKKTYLAHRIAWLMTTGVMPNGYIDHINGNRDDNRFSNLRVVDRATNSKNRKMGSNNTSGVTGVSWYKRHKKWVAQTAVNGKMKHLGYFDNVKDAERAINEARKLDGDYTKRHGKEK